MKRQYFFVFVVIFIMGFFLYFDLEKNITSLATDSGWDVGYDSSPGGGTTPSGGYHSGSDRGSGNYSNIGIMETIKLHSIFWLLFLLIFVGICIVIIPLYIQCRKLSKKLPRFFYRDITFHRIKELPKTVENQQILDEGYQIYLDVQKAWMNFDYHSLRDLVTDELYNSYYNQLEVLKLKKQKNIMSDFSFIESHLIKKIEEHGITTIEMLLVVSFYDYVISNENQDEKMDRIFKVVRGNTHEKVEMTYSLTFVYREEASSRCPNCGSELEKGEAFCPYCKSHIQTPTKKMKLSKKQALRQK